MVETRFNRRKRDSIIPCGLHEHVGGALHQALAIHLLRDDKGSCEWQRRVSLVKGRIAGTALFSQPLWDAIQNAPDLLGGRSHVGQSNRALPIGRVIRSGQSSRVFASFQGRLAIGQQVQIDELLFELFRFLCFQGPRHLLYEQIGKQVSSPVQQLSDCRLGK